MRDGTYLGKQRNGWKVIGIIFIIITICAVSVGMFFGLKYFDMKTNLDDKDTQISSLTSQITALNSQQNTATNIDTNTEQLIITEWGLKATIPAGITEVQYVIEGDTAHFIAKPASDTVMYAPGVTEDILTHSIVSMRRSTSGANEAVPGEFQSNNVELGGYHYLLGAAQGVLGIYNTSTGESDLEHGVIDQLIPMLKAVELL